MRVVDIVVSQIVGTQRIPAPETLGRRSVSVSDTGNAEDPNGDPGTLLHALLLLILLYLYYIVYTSKRLQPPIGLCSY